MQFVRRRTIIEEHRFAIELAALIEGGPRRADEFVDGAKWLLARSPESGSRLGASKVWFLPMKEPPGILPVVLYYTFDDDYVNFLSIQETVYPPQGA
jgi:hypothetical protein